MVVDAAQRTEMRGFEEHQDQLTLTGSEGGAPAVGTIASFNHSMRLRPWVYVVRDLRLSRVFSHPGNACAYADGHE